MVSFLEVNSSYFSSLVFKKSFSKDNLIILLLYLIVDKIYEAFKTVISISSLDSNANGVYIGEDGVSIGSNFKVSSGGTVTISDYVKATIKK